MTDTAAQICKLLSDFQSPTADQMQVTRRPRQAPRPRAL